MKRRTSHNVQIRVMPREPRKVTILGYNQRRRQFSYSPRFSVKKGDEDKGWRACMPETEEKSR